MKKLILITISILVFTLAGCNKDTENKELTVVLDWTPNTNHTGLYVALEKGYFEDQGLDVEIIQPNGTSEQLVATNVAQFGISAQEYVISARANELPVVSIAGIIGENTSGFISRKDTNILTPKDFENKTYCGWGSPTESAIIKELVEGDGGNFDLVDIQTNYLDLFTDFNNDCDFFWVFEAWQVEQAKLDSIEYNYLSMVDYSSDLDFYTPVIITSEDMIANDEKTVEAFMEAVQKGYKYAIENPEDSADILIKHAPELDADLVKASQNTISTFYKSTEAVWGYQQDTLWTTFNDWLLENEIVTQIELTKAYTNDYINE